MPMHTTAEIALTPDDFSRYQKVASRRLVSRSGMRWITAPAKIVMWLLIASTLFMFFRFCERYPEEATALDTMGILGLAALVLTRSMPYAAQARLRRYLIAPNGSFLRPHVLQFTEEALTIKSAVGLTELQWPTFIGSDQDATNYYLFSDACNAQVVPRAAVADFQADFDRYVARIPTS